MRLLCILLLPQTCNNFCSLKYTSLPIHTIGDVEILGNLSFTINSIISDELVQFTLTCISTGGIGKTVTWAKDSKMITGQTTSVLDDPVTTQYTHTLTVTGSIDGPNTYKCTVSNTSPSEDTANFTVQGIVYANFSKVNI